MDTLDELRKDKAQKLETGNAFEPNIDEDIWRKHQEIIVKDNEHELPEMIVKDNEHERPEMIVKDNEHERPEMIVKDNEQERPEIVVKDNEQDRPEIVLKDNEQDRPEIVVSDNEQDRPEIVVKDNEQERPEIIKDDEGCKVTVHVEDVVIIENHFSILNTRGKFHGRFPRNRQEHGKRITKDNGSDYPKLIFEGNFLDCPKGMAKDIRQKHLKGFPNENREEHPTSIDKEIRQKRLKRFSNENRQEHPTSIASDNGQEHPTSIASDNGQEHPTSIAKSGRQDLTRTSKDEENPEDDNSSLTGLSLATTFSLVLFGIGLYTLFSRFSNK